MSDPMKNTEIEDVLSSIRRLVTDGEPELTLGDDLPVINSTKGADSTDKLVLTAALRVAEPAAEDKQAKTEDTVEEAPEDAAAVAPEDDGAPADAEVGEDLSAVPEEGPEEGATQSAPDDGLAPSQDDAGAVPEPETTLGDDRGDAGDDLEEAHWMPEGEDASESTEMQVQDADIIEENWVVPDVGDAGEGPVESVSEPEDEPAEAQVREESSGSEASELAWTDQVVSETAPAVDPDEDLSLEDRVAELEAAVIGADDEWEPDGSEVEQRVISFDELEAGGSTAVAPDVADVLAFASARRGEEPAFQHAMLEEPEGVEDPDTAVQREGDEQGAEPRLTADDDGVFESEDDVLNEDALRELISDIVREELQGALGERITRNVRKLVRREINRALASKSFD